MAPSLLLSFLELLLGTWRVRVVGSWAHWWRVIFVFVDPPVTALFSLFSIFFLLGFGCAVSQQWSQRCIEWFLY
jgi:hypothetical protein